MGQRHKTLVVHIGDHKTGSTSIQYAFAQGRVTLKGRSVFYPAKTAHNMLKRHFWAYTEPEGSPARNKAIAVFEELGRKIQASNTDFCLISAEDLEEIAPAVLHDVIHRYWAAETDKVQVVAYVRPHAARIVSSFVERTKTGILTIQKSNLTIFSKQLQAGNKIFYQPRFAAWRAQFGSGFLLRPMIPARLFQGSVVHDFIRHGFDLLDFDVKEGNRANEALYLEDLMRLKVLQQHCTGQDRPVRSALGWEFARAAGTLTPAESQNRLRLHRDLAEQIHAAYIEDARATDRMFFDGEPLLETELDTALERAAEIAQQSVDPADYLSAGEMRSLGILSEVIAGMLQNTGEKWPKYLRQRRVSMGQGPEKPEPDKRNSQD